MAAPGWRSTTSGGMPCRARSAAANMPTRLPPTTRTGVSCSDTPLSLNAVPQGGLKTALYEVLLRLAGRDELPALEFPAGVGLRVDVFVVATEEQRARF